MGDRDPTRLGQLGMHRGNVLLGQVIEPLAASRSTPILAAVSASGLDYVLHQRAVIGALDGIRDGVPRSPTGRTLRRGGPQSRCSRAAYRPGMTHAPLVPDLATLLRLGDRPMSDMTGEQAFATSADGTRIAYWCGGRGQAIAFLHGLTATHRSWQPIADRLADRFRTCTVDRRGRGVSGDTLPYAFEREAEDVVAVAEAIGPLTVLGHSLSGPLALEAALRTPAIASLIVYEGWGAGEGVATDEELAELDALVVAGRLEEVLFYGDSPEEIARTRALPDFAERVAAAATVPREIRGFDAYWSAHLSDARWTSLGVPVLLLIGELNREAMEPRALELAARLPRASVRILSGQGHFAYHTAPDLLADEIARWLTSLGDTHPVA